MEAASRHKPSPDFIVRLIGHGVKPWAVPMRTLARVLDAVQRLVDQREDEFAEDAVVGDFEGQEEIAAESVATLRLVDVKAKSAGYAVAAKYGAAAIAVISDVGKAIQRPKDADWSGSTISSIKELSEVARSLGCIIEFGKPGGDVLAKITPLTYREVSESAFVHGYTSIYAALVRIGGATEPHCGLRLPDQSRMVFCHVNPNLIREMGKFLYQDIVVGGDATWLRHNWQLKDLKITSFEPPKKGSIRDVLKKLYNAGGAGWDSVADPDKYISEMRGA